MVNAQTVERWRKVVDSPLSTAMPRLKRARRSHKHHFRLSLLILEEKEMNAIFLTSWLVSSCQEICLAYSQVLYSQLRREKRATKWREWHRRSLRERKKEKRKKKKDGVITERGKKCRTVRCARGGNQHSFVIVGAALGDGWWVSWNPTMPPPSQAH